LKNYLVVKKPENLGTFLSRFDIILKSIESDLEALERIAYEAVEDAAAAGVIYFEARFCPHILMPSDVATEMENEEARMIWVYDVTGALIKGLIRGQTDFKTKGNLIATSIRGLPEHWYDDTLTLVADKSFHGGKIVGVDIAGFPDTYGEESMLHDAPVAFFDTAVKLGIRRTIHAGESGGPDQVTGALDILHAERIGHGYRIVNDTDVYNRIKDEKVHLECCPWSSILTGSISANVVPHPIIRFFEDGFNVSVNTDDPTVTGTRLEDEYRLLSNWGLSEAHYVKATFNAARSCFLPENEKADLIQDISKTYGFIK
jgi:adenosine deaminase